MVMMSKKASPKYLLKWWNYGQGQWLGWDFSNDVVNMHYCFFFNGCIPIKLKLIPSIKPKIELDIVVYFFPQSEINKSC